MLGSSKRCRQRRLNTALAPHVALHLFKPGDKVVKNEATWRANAFDSWGRGVGVGVVVEPPHPLSENEVDVRWPGGRCFEECIGLLPAESVQG